jgi:hypothetical protein
MARAITQNVVTLPQILYPLRNDPGLQPLDPLRGYLSPGPACSAPLAADPLPPLSPSRSREPSLPELVDSDAFPVSLGVTLSLPPSREPFGGLHLFAPAKFRDPAIYPEILTLADFPRLLPSSSPSPPVDSLWASLPAP